MDKITQLKAFLDSNPSDDFVQHALALEYLKKGEEEEARKLFESVLTQNEDYVGSYYHLAQLLQQQGKGEEAIKWYEKGMAKAKANGDTHSYNELLAAYEDLIG